jgi:hypothetical protein
MNTNTTPPFLWKLEGLHEGAKKKKKRWVGIERLLLLLQQQRTRRILITQKVGNWKWGPSCGET